MSIPLFKPYLGADTTKAAVDALDLGWLGMGSYVKEFEERLSAFLELPPDRHLVAVNTCTSALHLALLLAGVEPGDEVITPSLNNMGDFQAINMCGATPSFIDIRESDLGIDPSLIEGLITPRTKAIIALHYMGIPCDMIAVRSIAKRHNIRVIEDAAHATATRNHGRMVGSDGDLVCLSFDAIKTLTCIDGGAVITPRTEERDRLYPLRLLGMTQGIDRLYGNSRSYKYDVQGPGFRYHLANIHASIGLSQLARLPEFIENRTRYGRIYDHMLGDIDSIVTPQTDYDGVSLFMYVIRVLNNKRAELQTFLKERGIDTGTHWMPGHQFTFLKECRGAKNLPVTDRIGEEILTIPLWSYMDERIIEQVANAIRTFYGLGPRDRIYSSRPRSQLHRLKRQVFAIPVEDFEGARLRTVSSAAPTEVDVACLTEWRNRHPKSFQTEFDATPARTRSWLVNKVGSDDSRVIFMIEDQGRPVGYVGIAFIDWEKRTAEADSVVRGVDGRPGLMRAALSTLLDWARQDLMLERFMVRVLSDNEALSFYARFGFSELRRTPLKRVTREDCISWEPAPGESSERSLVHMELR